MTDTVQPIGSEVRHGGRFAGKRALVTGAGGGIGRATARLLASEGALVLVSDVDRETAEETARLINATGGVAFDNGCDVSDAADVDAMVRSAVAAIGGLDIAVNNAGIDGQLASVMKQRRSDWDAVIAVNLTGVFLGMQYELPELLAAGGGAIVNVASIAGRQGFPGMSPYVASKHGVIGLTRSAAAEYGSRGVRVNALCPGYTRTRMAENVDDSAATTLIARTPLRRVADPSEMAAAVAYLCSEAASYVTGAEIVVDGGMTMSY